MTVLDAVRLIDLLDKNPELHLNPGFNRHIRKILIETAAASLTPDDIRGSYIRKLKLFEDVLDRPETYVAT